MVALRSSSPVFSVQARTIVFELDDPEDGVTDSQLSLETILQSPTETTSMNWLPPWWSAGLVLMVIVGGAVWISLPESPQETASTGSESNAASARQLAMYLLSINYFSALIPKRMTLVLPPAAVVTVTVTSSVSWEGRVIV